MSLAKLKALHASATPGPWYLLEAPWLGRGMNTMVIAGSRDPHVALSVCDLDCQGDDEDRDNPHIWEDAELIAYMRTHAADFIALIEAADAVDTDWNVATAAALREALKTFEDGK